MEEKKPDISQEEKDIIIQVTTAIEAEAHKTICMNVYNSIQKEKDKDPKTYDHILTKIILMKVLGDHINILIRFCDETKKEFPWKLIYSLCELFNSEITAMLKLAETMVDREALLKILNDAMHEKFFNESESESDFESEQESSTSSEEKYEQTKDEKQSLWNMDQ